MMRVVDRLDIVEVGTPVFHIASLSSRDEPVMAMGPCERCDTGLDLIVVCLYIDAN